MMCPVSIGKQAKELRAMRMLWLWLECAVCG